MCLRDGLIVAVSVAHWSAAALIFNAVAFALT